MAMGGSRHAKPECDSNGIVDGRGMLCLAGMRQRKEEMQPVGWKSSWSNAKAPEMLFCDDEM